MAHPVRPYVAHRAVPEHALRCHHMAARWRLRCTRARSARLSGWTPRHDAPQAGPAPREAQRRHGDVFLDAGHEPRMAAGRSRGPTPLPNDNMRNCLPAQPHVLAHPDWDCASAAPARATAGCEANCAVLHFDLRPGNIARTPTAFSPRSTVKATHAFPLTKNRPPTREDGRRRLRTAPPSLLPDGSKDRPRDKTD